MISSTRHLLFHLHRPQSVILFKIFISKYEEFHAWYNYDKSMLLLVDLVSDDGVFGGGKTVCHSFESKWSIDLRRKSKPRSILQCFWPRGSKPWLAKSFYSKEVEKIWLLKYSYWIVKIRKYKQIHIKKDSKK